MEKGVKEIISSQQKKSNENIKINIGLPLIECTYDIKDTNLVQIMNDRGITSINEEVVLKIKILNDENIFEPLILQKQFNKLGMNTVIFVIEENLSDMSFLFNKCYSLKKIQFFNFTTIHATKMIATFQECKEVEYIYLSNLDISNVTNICNLFNGCQNLKEIKGINNFNTININTMYGMFGNCKLLEYLDLGNFNTSNVTDMSFMFEGCNRLKEIKGINKFNTNKVI